MFKFIFGFVVGFAVCMYGIKGTVKKTAETTSAALEIGSKTIKKGAEVVK